MTNDDKNDEVEIESVCPYCKKVLEKKPMKKKKCPFCNNFIYVRNRILVTENETIIIDAMKILEQYGVTEKDFENHKKKFKYEISDKDAIWSLYNKLLQKNFEENNFQILSRLYSDMALMLNKEGKDCFTFLQQARKMELLRYQRASVMSTIIKGVKIATCGMNSCEACHKLDGKSFTIEEALEKMLIPCKECTNKIFNDKYPFCRCCYTAELFDIKKIVFSNEPIAKVS